MSKSAPRPFAQQSSSPTVTKCIRDIFTKQDFMLLASCTVFAQPDCYFLDDWLKMTFASVDAAVRNISAAGPSPAFSPCKLDFLFGPLWAGHALHAEPLFWYKKLHEPDLTQLMAHAMNTEVLKTGHASLCHSFVRALCHCVGQEADPYKADEHDFITVLTEAQVNLGGRIDLLFRWGKSQAVNLIAIEVKFDADIKNPLENYSAHCKQLLQDEGSPNPPLKILLHSKGLKEKDFAHLHKGWHTVFWQELLPRWEAELAQVFSDQRELSCLWSDGTRMRHSLIAKVYGHNNAR